MFVRAIVSAFMLAFAGLAAAQATAPEAEAASAATPAPAASAADASADAPVKTATAPTQRCHKELPIGSTIPKTVCESELPADLEEMRKRALDDLRHTVTPGARPIGH